MEQKEITVPVEISARHIHLSTGDLDALFGKKHQLKRQKKLSQGQDFAAEETVDIEANEQEIRGVRVIGPPRPNTQLELTFSDAHRLKMDLPVRTSGEIEGTPGFKIIGPSGAVVKKEGMIIAKRHLHAAPEDAQKHNLKPDGEVSLICGDSRQATFHKLVVRVQPGFKLIAHIDVDEANAAGLKTCSLGKMIF
ncbi:MAG: phosphate propanoyltransferase [Candidatus Moranbacteria bacterium]|nr:phosphate propanoyltransferase [Candidatus Moranbacteria bacterium]